MTVSEFFSLSAASAKSLVKVMLGSRRVTLPRSTCHGAMVIMGNGPSLSGVIANNRDSLMSMPRLAVNFAATAPEFGELRPEYYLMVDPLFFGDTPGDNFVRLRDELSRIDWPMTLIVPANRARLLSPQITGNKFITVVTINCIGARGYRWLENLLYSSGRAMPRPRNVLIPAIMAALYMGYDTIWLTGADHSWMKTISVDDNNNVISVQPHFYKDNASEQRRVDTTYRGLRLHQVVGSFAIAFEAYHTVARYAGYRHVNIYNATPGSFIDAFRRAPLGCPPPDTNPDIQHTH